MNIDYLVDFVIQTQEKRYILMFWQVNLFFFKYKNIRKKSIPVFFSFSSAHWDFTMDSMETVLDTGLGDVETDAMSPLASPGNEVSELEQEAVALAAAASMEQEDEEDSVTGMLWAKRDLVNAVATAGRYQRVN